MSDQINNGGPAFPVADFDHQAFAPKNAEEAKRLLSGMTLRDYFAARAMQGLMGRVWGDVPAEDLFEIWARSAYAAADSMLKAREK